MRNDIFRLCLCFENSLFCGRGRYHATVDLLPVAAMEICKSLVSVGSKGFIEDKKDTGNRGEAYLADWNGSGEINNIVAKD